MYKYNIFMLLVMLSTALTLAEESDTESNLSKYPSGEMVFSIFSYLVRTFGDSPNTSIKKIREFSEDYAEHISRESMVELDFKLIKSEFSTKCLGVKIKKDTRQKPRRESRKVQNQRSAKKSRERHKQLMERLLKRIFELEKKHEVLKQENKCFKDEVSFLLSVTN